MKKTDQPIIGQLASTGATLFRSALCPILFLGGPVAVVEAAKYIAPAVGPAIESLIDAPLNPKGAQILSSTYIAGIGSVEGRVVIGKPGDPNIVAAVTNPAGTILTRFNVSSCDGKGNARVSGFALSDLFRDSQGVLTGDAIEFSTSRPLCGQGNVPDMDSVARDMLRTVYATKAFTRPPGYEFLKPQPLALKN